MLNYKPVITEERLSKKIQEMRSQDVQEVFGTDTSILTAQIRSITGEQIRQILDGGCIDYRDFLEAIIESYDYRIEHGTLNSETGHKMIFAAQVTLEAIVEIFRDMTESRGRN